jgi:hypothetical protein
MSYQGSEILSSGFRPTATKCCSEDRDQSLCTTFHFIPLLAIKPEIIIKGLNASYIKGLLVYKRRKSEKN